MSEVTSVLLGNRSLDIIRTRINDKIISCYREDIVSYLYF